MLKEECGIFGMYKHPDDVEHDVARLTYYGLYSLQHRGQESAGIAAEIDGSVVYTKGMGLVQEVFGEDVIKSLGKGSMAIGHVRYSTTGGSHKENAQPLVTEYFKGTLALVHNGNIANADELKEDLRSQGAIFQTTNDSEVIAYLIAKERINSASIEEAVLRTMPKLKGSYCLLVMSPRKIVVVRDPNGFRPLSIGKLDNSIVVSSETCAFDAMDAEFIRDVMPGEIVVLSRGEDDCIETKSIKDKTGLPSSICIFEYIYFSRPDSIIEGLSVYEARKLSGRILAEEHPVEADVVIGVPDSGLSAAMGYSEFSGIPCGIGLIKNRYVGRTFIKPGQNERANAVKLKLNVLKSAVENKRVVLIDDSIVRGTTSRRIIKMLRDAGAKEIHMRVSSPPFMHPCYFGTDIPNRDNLIACRYSGSELAEKLNADSIGFLSCENLGKIIPGKEDSFCCGCFSGKYPIEISGKCQCESPERSISRE